MSTKTILVILNILSLVGALIWMLTNPDWEPLLAVVGLIAALFAQLQNGEDNESAVNMTQEGGKNSTNYQSKGDININIQNDK